MIYHLLRFTLEILQRLKYINQKGEAIEWAGLINNLFYCEPFNFIFANFLKAGIFHQHIQLLKSQNMAQADIDIAILSILLSFFNRRKVHKSYTCHKLPPLPPSFKTLHQSYENALVDIYRKYLANYCLTNPKDVLDNELPGSKISFPSILNEPDIGLQEEWNFLLQDAKLIPVGVSSFVSQSGYEGAFSSPKELLETMKHTVILDNSVVPSTNIDSDSLSSYAVDFYKHGLYERTRRECQFKNLNELKRMIEQSSR
jgi:hypothetical protein